MLIAPEHHGDQAATSLRYHAETGPEKPTTDVIVNGVAHMPGGKRVKRLEVALRAGPVSKDLVVYGTRISQRSLVGTVTPSSPVLFERRQLLYEWGAPTKPTSGSRGSATGATRAARRAGA